MGGETQAGAGIFHENGYHRAWPCNRGRPAGVMEVAGSALAVGRR
jgi:hypothetical protein